MPNEYVLKTNPLSSNRLLKVAKQLIDESKEDRSKALVAYDYFKQIVDDFRADAELAQDVSVAERCMVDCLKLAQDSRNKAIKALELLVKTLNKTNASTSEVEEELGAEDFRFEDLA